MNRVADLRRRSPPPAGTDAAPSPRRARRSAPRRSGTSSGRRARARCTKGAARDRPAARKRSERRKRGAIRAAARSSATKSSSCAALRAAGAAGLVTAPPSAGRPGGRPEPRRARARPAPFAPVEAHLEPLEDPAGGRPRVAPARRVDRAGDDQPVDRARHRHVEQAPVLGLLRRLLGLLDVVVLEDAACRLPVTGFTNRKPKRPSGRQRISSARVPGGCRPASASTTTLNSSPFAAWTVRSRTASPPSSSATASTSARPPASWSRRNGRSPRRPGPRSSSYERASRASLRRFA